MEEGENTGAKPGSGKGLWKPQGKKPGLVKNQLGLIRKFGNRYMQMQRGKRSNVINYS